MLLKPPKETMWGKGEVARSWPRALAMEGGGITVSVTPNPGSQPEPASHFQPEEPDALLPTMRWESAAGSAGGPAPVEVMAAFVADSPKWLARSQ